MALGEEGPGLGSWGGRDGAWSPTSVPGGARAFLQEGAQRSRGWTLDLRDHLGSDPSPATYWLGDLNKLLNPSEPQSPRL